MADRLSKQFKLDKGIAVYKFCIPTFSKYVYRLAPLSVIKFCKQQKGVCI